MGVFCLIFDRVYGVRFKILGSEIIIGKWTRGFKSVIIKWLNNYQEMIEEGEKFLIIPLI